METYVAAPVAGTVTQVLAAPGAQVSPGDPLVVLGPVEDLADTEDAAWAKADLGRVPDDDTWVQWALTITLDEGDHELRVRAIDKDGLEQTGVRRDVVPDGATGWHTIQVRAG